MKASDLLISKIKEFEGCELKAYKDSKGIPTIGVGHTKGVKMGQEITQGQADMLLRNDIIGCETYVNRIGLARTQGQFDALVDFCFNLGCTALRNSTLFKLITTKASTAAIQAEFKKWNKCRVNGKMVELKGLTKRRAWEAERWAQ